MNYKLTLLKSVFILFLLLVLQTLFAIIHGILNDLCHVDIPLELFLFSAYITLFIYYFSKYKISFERLFHKINYKDFVLYSLFFTSVIVISTFIKFSGAPVHSVASEPIRPYTSNVELANDIFKVFSVVLIIPIMEELLFRGILFNGLMNKYKFWMALLISSILFAIMHTFTDIRLFLGVFLNGLCFAAAFYLTKNIFYSILGHIINNLLSFISVYLSKFYPENKLVSFTGEGVTFTPIIGIISVIVFLVLLLYLTVFRYQNRVSEESNTLK